MQRLLVANRGEIAVRIFRACAALGIETVAVFAPDDRGSLHVRRAATEVEIASYLDPLEHVRAARESGADAVHPGYGFLSERAAFARAITDAGLVFVGPGADVIERMGDKAAARRTAQEADVPVVPGTEPLADPDTALAAAEDIGYPVLVKASAGGGGRGIKQANTPAELTELFAAAQREAESAFGDGTVYLERSLDGARHVEVQVLADAHGNVVHAFERDCSVQRRRQKLFEEAPAPDLAEHLREAINSAAVRLAAQVGYLGAGTVELLLAPDGGFHFIEMNTRIQVEHPVTEAITGIDLVAEQLRIAGGEPLGVSQQDIRRSGAAVELRINAEDPDNNFQPTPGELSVFDLPSGDGVRVDTGFTEGDRISPFYDSMIAKLICWGDDRAEAFERARRALNEVRIEGVSCTVKLHKQLLDDAELRAGPVHTAWLERRGHSQH
jgi:acetyl-CoA carboxylase biotin carboxylase subunit